MMLQRARRNRPQLRKTGFIVLALAVGMTLATPVRAASKPTTVAEIALYRGPDRERLLIEGAKKEGQVTFYNSNTWMAVVSQEFEKKYPFVKVSIWRSDSKDLIKRIFEEYKTGRYIVDIIETSSEAIAVLQRERVLQEYYSPEMHAYEDNVKVKGKTGVYYLADREIYLGLGFNTKFVAVSEAPRSYQDLLDPKWRGKMSIAGGSIGPRWLGNVWEAMGREFVEKLGQQAIKLQNITPAALANLVVSGEVPLSPTMFDSNMFTAKRKGAPVEWQALEPVVTNVGFSGMTTRSTHPHAALLFMDYLHSKEGQQVVLKGGISSPREDIASAEKKFKKTYFETKYSIEEYEKRFNEWENLMRRLFIRR